MDGEGTHSSTPKIPEAIWQLYQRRYAVSSEVVHIRLRNGEIRHSLLVNDDGAIVGKVVGGQDGVDATAVDFSGQQIEAIRPAVGIVAALGLTRWVTAQS